MPPRFLAIALLVLAPALAQAAPASVDAVVQHSSCAHHAWPRRGVAPRGYLLGMGQAYARAVCELRQPQSTAARLAGDGFDADTDALALYGRAQGTPQQRLRALYALALGAGMRESTGNASTGLNRGVRHASSQDAEAGLFQVMPNSLDASPWLGELYGQYRARPATCLREVFMRGTRDRRQPVLGQGADADFQRFTKSCPAFAVDYAAVLLRTDARKFPPVRDRKVPLVAACEAMFEDIETAVRASCADTAATASAPPTGRPR